MCDSQSPQSFAEPVFIFRLVVLQIEKININFARNQSLSKNAGELDVGEN